MKRYSRRTPKKMVHMPQELIIEILLRLPVKSVVCFKTVCKTWLSLTSDPRFAISHFERCAGRTDRLVFMLECSNQALSVDLNASLEDDSASATLNLTFLPPTPFHCEILGSCRGLLLLSTCTTLCVCNPCTRAHKFVDPSPISATSSTFLSGFGYDSSKDDYLVVQAFCHIYAEFNPFYIDDHVTRVEYFSLRANAWKEIESIPVSYLIFCCDNATGRLFNGAIHWLAFRYDTEKNVIVVFNLAERSFSEMPIPDELDDCGLYNFNLGFLGECLSLCVDDYPSKIWVMKEYKVHSSWTKMVVVSVDAIPTLQFSLVCSTKNGDIFGYDGCSGLAKCNAKGELEEYRSYYGYHGTVYTETLLSLIHSLVTVSKLKKMTSNSE